MATYSKYIFILLFSFFALVIFNNVFTKNINIPFLITACSSPKTFQIVSINKNFNLSTSTAIAQAKLVALAWNKAAGKEVLKYEDGGEVKISFIYDERQREAINKKILSENIRVKEEELKKDNQSIADLKIDFENKNKIFETEKNAYENNLNTYNR